MSPRSFRYDRALLAMWIWALALGCSGNVSSSSQGGAAGSTGGSATTTGGTGGSTTTTGGTGGTGGSSLKGRQCGMGAPCSGAAKCELAFIEGGVKCDCDPSAHFFCVAYAGGGAPPWNSCTKETACGQGGAAGGGTSCSESNGFCTKTCDCNKDCALKCDGKGPAEGDPGYLCDESYCEGNGTFSCSVEDGACNYKVQCELGTPKKTTVTGNCP